VVRRSPSTGAQRWDKVRPPPGAADHRMIELKKDDEYPRTLIPADEGEPGDK
jgi:hypothetical protein